jgi:colanic acid biosynthesis glycosyl transferase WcaI
MLASPLLKIRTITDTFRPLPYLRLGAKNSALFSLPQTDPPSRYSIEPLASRHIEPAVDVHLQAFPSFFLSSLGPHFLREFYASFLADRVGIGFVARSPSGDVMGAVLGPLNPQGYFKRLLRRRWWAFCLASVGAVGRHPTCLKRLLRAVFYRGEAPSGPVRALLSSISVSPSAQGHGVGKALVHRWVVEARRRGANGCYLTTDAEGNDAVNAFYRGLGWRLESAYITPEARRMNRYVFDW